jgi:titin
VWAYNDSGDSLLPSNNATASLLPCPPTGLSLTTMSMIRINLQWNDTSQNEDGFRIERSSDSLSRSWGWSATVDSGVTTYSDASLACGASYVYRV